MYVYPVTDCLFLSATYGCVIYIYLMIQNVLKIEKGSSAIKVLPSRGLVVKLKLNKIQLGIIKPGLALNKVHTSILELLNSEVDWVILILVLKLLGLEKRT